MVAFARVHPEYVQAEMKFYRKRDAKQLKCKNDTEAGPSSSYGKKNKNVGPSDGVNVDSDG